MTHTHTLTHRGSGIENVSLQDLFPVKIFFCNPVVLKSICYRTRANQLINESNTTGELQKIGREGLLFRLRHVLFDWGPLLTSICIYMQMCRKGIKFIHVLRTMAIYGGVTIPTAKVKFCK